MKRILVLAASMLFAVISFSQPSNDNCNTATAIPAGNLDDGNGNCTPLAGESNVGATGWLITPPNLYYTANCWGGAIDSLVFYSFTAQGVSGSVEVTNGPGMPHIAVLTSCDPATAIEVGCAVDAPVMFDNQLTIGATYYIAVGFAGNAMGNFDICVFNPVPAPNDQCMNAITINNLDGNCNTGYNNYYPSTDVLVSGCIVAPNTYSVWYKFVAQGVSIADLHIENGPDAANVAVYDFSGGPACTFPTTALACQQNVDFNNPIVLDNQLTIGNEYYIQVTFDNNAVGDFDLCLDNPVPAFNDDCMNAPVYPPAELNDSLNCLTNIAGNDLNNDWPSTDIGQTYGCWDANSTYNVWFQFVAQGPDVDINVDPTFGQVEQIALIEFTGAPCDPAAWVIWDCANGGDLEINNQLDPGTTYYVAVGFSNNGVGDYCINVFNPEPPVNDTACAAIPFPLAGTSQVCEPNQTTTYANPEFPANNFPGACQGVVENTVWYTLQLTDPSNVGFEIEIQQLTQMGDVSVVLFEATQCDGAFSIFDFYCGPLPPVDTIQFGPVDETVNYYLMIGSSEGGQGEFNLCISEIPPCFDNNFCEDPLGVSSAIDLGTLTTLTAACPPTGPPDSTFVCVMGCNEFADADPDMMGCLGVQAAPTVWYTFTTDNQANIVNINITSQEFESPAIMLWQDNGGCGNLIGPIGLTQANLACVTGSGGELVANSTDVGAGTTYYLSVAGVNTAGGNFELCLTAIEEGSACVLDANVEVTARTFSGPLTGPFFPGETVSVCLNVNTYTSSGNNCQWFQGIVPVFGNGWDPSLSFEGGLGTPPVNATLNGNPFPAQGQSGSPAGIWDWFSDANYHYPHCFYNIGDFDGNGSLDMCNGLYDQNCVGPGLQGGSSGPCWGGIPGDGDQLPPGWFHYNIQGACPQIGHPNVDWGDGACCNCTMGPWEFCFDLTVRPYPDCETDLTTQDLTIGFVTFADGETGTWTGGPSICGQDEPVFEKLPGCCTELQFLNEEHPPFCDGGVFTWVLDNPAADFWEWTVNAPPSIIGASGGNGPSGTVVIDNLTNTGTTSEIVVYSFAGFDGGDCPSIILEVEVEVFAEITVDMEPFTVCSTPTNPYEIIPQVEGGDPASYSYQWHDGSTNPTFMVTNPTAGQQYVVTVTDAVGCSGTASVVLDVYTTFPVDIDAPVLGQCAVDGTIDLNAEATGGMPGYTYEWTTPTGGNVSGSGITADESGEWLVIATDSEGCVGADSVEIEFWESPTVEVFPDNVAVCPDNQFATQMNANVFGGQPPYLYEWTTPLGTVVTSFLLVEQAGNYNILITDNNGCTAELDFEVFEAPSPQVDLGEPATVCPIELFSGIVVEVPFDPSYLFYEWSTGSEDPSIIVNQVGTYTVTVTNNGGCTGTAEYSVDLYEQETFDLPDTFAFCAGNFGVIDAGPGWDSYEWSTGDDFQEIFVFQEELIFITVTDFNGCTYTDEIQVVEAQFLVPEILGDSVICNGVPVDVMANSGFATYEWSTGSTDQTITVDTGGWYFVTVSDGDGCFGQDSVLILDAAPSPGITGLPAVCEGDSILLDVGAWSAVEWSTGETTPTIFVDTSGTYFVTVTDQYGCQNSTSMAITIVAPPDPDITGTTDFCEGDSAFLDAGAGFSTYAWSTGESSQTINPTSSGTIYLTVTNAGGCEGYDTISVNEAAALSPAITGDSVVCNAVPVDLDAGGGFAEYAWSNGGDTQVISVSAGNTYTVTVTDSEGCTGTDQIVVQAGDPDPQITGNEDVCAGGSEILTASAGFSSYNWSTGASTPTISVNASDSYIVTVTDALGCTGTAVFDFTVNANPTPNITGSATFCTGSQTTLDAGGNYASYSWTGGSTGQTLVVTSSGTYSVTVTDGNGCTGTTSLMVTESSELVLNVQDQVICEGQTATLSVGSFDTYNWSTGAMTPTIDVTTTTT
ncbi:MAG: hypothetical protein R3301_14500, partial [Saprospiraceae bacterium]|nr:hypothetical protein [Saprospiraceae bacterium]